MLVEMGSYPCQSGWKLVENQLLLKSHNYTRRKPLALVLSRGQWLDDQKKDKAVRVVCPVPPPLIQFGPGPKSTERLLRLLCNGPASDAR